MNALFIGRFQPFHKGHLKILEELSSKYDEIVIGIGSSQYENQIDNPFSEDERKKMIDISLKNNNINNFKIISIPDIHDPPNWVSHVLSIINDFDVVISNNPLTIKLFSERGYTVVKTPPYKKEKYSGKVIRNNIIKGFDWKDLVPEATWNVIEEIQGVYRLKKLANK